MAARFLSSLKAAVKESGIFPSYLARKRAAARFLRGSGLEIGALHFPLQVPPGVTVKYVDYVSREENIRRFPELDAAGIVPTDYVEDGFTLASIPDFSQDFVIANHVLEHASNPFQVLSNWARVLRPGGTMFISVPIGKRCFDKGRPVTPLQHFIDDYELVRDGRSQLLEERNRQHYMEWLTISMPNLDARNRHYRNLPGEELESLVETMSAGKAEIHFHVFSRESFVALLDYFTTGIRSDFSVKAVIRSRGGAESLAILERSPQAGR
uniref:Class I SAM-dependent methyltransferase n=1 Tax=Geobacter metallireducens TaxID=28232 RepID=A0A831UF62_GEOME